LNLALPEDV